jgi:hypothetical protein
MACCASLQQTIGVSAREMPPSKRLRKMCWHVPQPVNAAEPHQKPARALFSSDNRCATCDSSYKIPLFDEIALATVAQCMSRRLHEPEVPKYPSILRRIFAKQRRKKRPDALIELQRSASCCI